MYNWRAKRAYLYSCLNGARERDTGGEGDEESVCTSSNATGISTEAGSSVEMSSDPDAQAPSLLRVLHSPVPSQLARKRKISSNRAPPTGLKRCRGETAGEPNQ